MTIEKKNARYHAQRLYFYNRLTFGFRNKGQILIVYWKKTNGIDLVYLSITSIFKGICKQFEVEIYV